MQMLRENINLKETLKYNTSFIEEQINILTTLKTEVTEAYENNKFAYLKEQNDDMKMLHSIENKSDEV